MEQQKNEKTVETPIGISAPSSARSFDQVPICSGLDVISNPSLERWTEFFRPYLRQTVSKHLARLHLDNFHFWSRAPSLHDERCQLDVCRFTTGALALDHVQRCRGITTQDLLCRLIRFLGIASTFQ